jgi:hypothetical protein
MKLLPPDFDKLRQQRDLNRTLAKSGGVNASDFRCAILSQGIALAKSPLCLATPRFAKVGFASDSPLSGRAKKDFRTPRYSIP